jgi:hypothetical protein
MFSTVFEPRRLNTTKKNNAGRTEKILRMKNLVIIFTILIVALSVISSVVGILNNRILHFERLVTQSGEQVEILSEGICKYNVKSWVLSVMA